jgi:hypothetical protein
MRWLLAERQSRLEAGSAGNIGALLEVRDKTENSMARVPATKMLEQMLNTVSVQKNGSSQVVAGQAAAGADDRGETGMWRKQSVIESLGNRWCFRGIYVIGCAVECPAAGQRAS